MFFNPSRTLTTAGPLIGRPAAAKPSALIPLLLFLVLAVFAYETERRGIGVSLVVAAGVFLYFLFRLLGCGPILGSILALSTVFFIFAASKFKFWLTARRLHPFDFYVYGDINNVAYIKVLYPSLYLYVYAGIAAFVIGIATIAYFERFRAPTRAIVLGFLLSTTPFVAFAASSRYMDGNGYGQGNRFLHFDHQHVSTFVIASIHVVPNLLSEQLFQYGPPQPIDPIAVSKLHENACHPKPGTTLPDVVTVLRESITIPSRIPAMKVPQIDDSYFRSFDGLTHTMRVETHGAGSAFTIFSVLTGISTEAFGGAKILALDLMPGKIDYSMAKLMTACGYRTIVVSSGIAGYVASEAFYRAAGFGEYYDVNALKKHSGGDTSDRAIYAYLESFLTSPNDNRPIYAYIDTTASHAPYDFKLRPNENIDEAKDIGDPSIAEYVRRLMLGEHDLTSFMERAQQRANSGERPLVVLDFGDHQPLFTKDLPGHPGYILEDSDHDDPHLLTYFRIRAVQFKLEPVPTDHAVVDAAFISDWLLKALGWGVQGVYEARWQMVEKCKSRYWQCENRAAAYTLHQSLKQAGYIKF